MSSRHVVPLSALFRLILFFFLPRFDSSREKKTGEEEEEEEEEGGGVHASGPATAIGSPGARRGGDSALLSPLFFFFLFFFFYSSSSLLSPATSLLVFLLPSPPKPFFPPGALAPLCNVPRPRAGGHLAPRTGTLTSQHNQPPPEASLSAPFFLFLPPLIPNYFFSLPAKVSHILSLPPPPPSSSSSSSSSAAASACASSIPLCPSQSASCSVRSQLPVTGIPHYPRQLLT